MTAKKIGIFFLLSLFTQFFVLGQVKKGFVLDGNIEGLKDKTTLYLITADKDTISRTISKNSQFRFTGFIPGEANYYFLMLDTQFTTKPSNALWLANTDMRLIGDLKKWPEINLCGSEPNDEYYELRKIYYSSKDKDTTLIALKKFVASHHNSLYISELIMRMAPALKISGMDSAYQLLTPRAKTSYYGQLLKDKIESIKSVHAQRANRKDSLQLPNFTYTSIDGKKMNILDAVNKSEYTLIDFWASWCAPCRAAIPTMKKVYADFHNRGFNIIGISMDKKEADWKKAVNEDATTWEHGLDNIQDAGKKLFGFKAIPAYFIVDKNGKVLKTNSGYFSNTAIKAYSMSFSVETGLYSIMETLLKNTSN